MSFVSGDSIAVPIHFVPRFRQPSIKHLYPDGKNTRHTLLAPGQFYGLSGQLSGGAGVG
jgi:hypothetical protein